MVIEPWKEEQYPKLKNRARKYGARIYLMALRWPEGFVCPRCGMAVVAPRARRLPSA